MVGVVGVLMIYQLLNKTRVLKQSDYDFNEGLDASCGTYNPGGKDTKNVKFHSDNSISIKYGGMKTGRIQSTDTFGDGLYIIEATVPSTGSCFPAIWLSGGDGCCEIDIMESMNPQTFAMASVVNIHKGVRNTSQVWPQGKYELNGKGDKHLHKFVLLRLNNHVVVYLFDTNDPINLSKISPKNNQYIEYDLNYLPKNSPSNNPTIFQKLIHMPMKLVLNVAIQSQDHCSFHDGKHDCDHCNQDGGQMLIKSVTIHEFV